MYEKFLRNAYDPWFPIEAATYHTGSRHEVRNRCLIQVRQAAAGGTQAREEIGPKLFKWVTDSRLLRAAWDNLAAYGGTAPGPNGRRYDDLDDHEVWDLLAAISEALRKGTYRPGPDRKVKILKDRTQPGRGSRLLRLLDIEDRVVQRAIVEILQPLLDPLFGEHILGFRPGRNRVHALALAERLTMEDRYVWLAEDIENAFDNVPIGRLLDVVQKYVPSQDLVGLIELVVEAGGRRGIRQGGPLSPLLLNLYLYHHLEKLWAKMFPGAGEIRVADDILVVCRTQKEARSAWTELDGLLRPAGMSLKHGPQKSIADLRRGDSPDWLGFRVWKGKEGLEVKIAKRSWQRLGQYLQLAHEKPDAPLRAVDTINGWVDQLGPCYRYVNRSRKCGRIERFAAEYGFDEIPSRSALLSRWRRAYERWEEFRKEGLQPQGHQEAKETTSDKDHEPTLVKEGFGPAAAKAPF